MITKLNYTMELLKQIQQTQFLWKNLNDVWPGCGALLCELDRTVDDINYYLSTICRIKSLKWSPLKGPHQKPTFTYLKNNCTRNYITEIYCYKCNRNC